MTDGTDGSERHDDDDERHVAGGSGKGGHGSGEKVAKASAITTDGNDKMHGASRPQAGTRGNRSAPRLHASTADGRRTTYTTTPTPTITTDDHDAIAISLMTTATDANG